MYIQLIIIICIVLILVYLLIDNNNLNKKINMLEGKLEFNVVKFQASIDYINDEYIRSNMKELTHCEPYDGEIKHIYRTKEGTIIGYKKNLMNI